MTLHLHSLPAAALLVTCAAFMPFDAIAGVRVCTFPGSPSTALDQKVASETFRTAGIAATIVTHGIANGDDDGVSLKELDKTLGHQCDVIAGFPRSPVADATGGKMLFSRGYLRSGYVSIESANVKTTGVAQNTVAAMYASPAQLIAVQQTGVRLDLENTSALSVEAVAAGRARRAIVWYPAVVAYGRAHPEQRFTVSSTASPYADWHLVFAFASSGATLQKSVDAALDKMTADGRLAALTHEWALPASQSAAESAHAPKVSYLERATVPHAQQGGIRLAVAGTSTQGRFIKVSDAASTDVPSFDRMQANHGKALYASSCAKCHGGALQGVTGPALRGPAFAPISNAHLTVGGIFGYMATNMPADRPGKLKDQDYADIMAFLLFSNGYTPGSTKLTADNARTSATKLIAGPAH
ncbi:c-type cytochrome [Paraburkholderia sartisoli]|uniref:Cytochrome C oxidase, cbb3-type, subunit III n=1 Tax=Paraburkholderia sartisoli TaxID=83784 RepID=A0A1H4H543_9BURK|nr:c-type cytochrome [Paraburkholderia sartisoli]SEB16500.1 Cytochrome C oxidase, cbb3-type, subunit III [Paraburkholderia sartisoli]